MKANSLTKSAAIAGGDFLIMDNGKVTKRVDFDTAAEFFKGKFFGGGGEPHRKRIV